MSKVKILCFGDQHFDTIDVNVLELFISKSEKLVEEVKPDFVICLGDMLHYHDTIYTHTLNKAYEFIEKISKIAKTFILVGNHDMIGPACFLDEKSHWLNGIKRWENVTIVDKVVNYNFNELKFTLLPYVAPGRFKEALNTHPGWENSTCIFAHQEMYGCKMGAFFSVDGDEWDKKYPPIISGHIHCKQFVEPNIFYTGSAIQTSFGETTNKSITQITIPPTNNDDILKNMGLTYIDLNLPKKHIIYKTVDELLSNQWIPPVDTDQYKITLNGNHEEFKTFKKSNQYTTLITSGVKVVFKHDKRKMIHQQEIIDSLKDTKVSFNNILYELCKDDVNLTAIYKKNVV
jgi:predicted MPP superfamily phosphohydrolase